MDQCGLRSDTRRRAVAGRRSCRPRSCGSMGNGCGNIMFAIAFRGGLWFTVFTGRFTAAAFIDFLDRLARQADRKVHLIADRHPVHRSGVRRSSRGRWGWSDDPCFLGGAI
ncbi:transposase [Nocardia sp. AB354]|uniref:transposase n=1 Tax=Nocardia sp. AB354 TaxID=3413283 RepID=UPI003C16701F